VYSSRVDTSSLPFSLSLHRHICGDDDESWMISRYSPTTQIPPHIFTSTRVTLYADASHPSTRRVISRNEMCNLPLRHSFLSSLTVTLDVSIYSQNNCRLYTKMQRPVKIHWPLSILWSQELLETDQAHTLNGVHEPSSDLNPLLRKQNNPDGKCELILSITENAWLFNSTADNKSVVWSSSVVKDNHHPTQMEKL